MNHTFRCSTCVAILFSVTQFTLLVLPPTAGAADDEGVRFFESKIRPLLAEHCYECHGEQQQESDLRLDTYAGISQGGASGMAVVPHQPEQSLLLAAVSYRDPDLQMPPETRLPDRALADLRRWIELGAPHPAADAALPQPRASMDLEQERQFWAFQPPVVEALPKVQSPQWVRSAIDRFILARLEAQGMHPVPIADKRTLIRRATFDLHGLPPTPDEIAAFLADDSPSAFARVVERLLGSVHYGERWGRHWLDVARYADSNGLDENIAHGNAWRYRDYVIGAFNDDTPFDQFVLEQIAGDLLTPAESEQQQLQRRIATGFLSLGPKVLAEVDERKMEMDIVDEQIDTFGRAFLGLTLGCARCHAHKFDPIRTEDYYALAGIFQSTKTMESFTKIARWHENSVATADDQQARQEHDRLVAAEQAAIEQLLVAANQQLQDKLGAGAALPKDAEAQFPDETKAELQRRRAVLAELEKSAPQLPTAMGVAEGDLVEARVHLRGSHLSLGKTVPRGVPAVFVRTRPVTWEDRQSGRLQLAEWLVARDHPLSARVIANRVWRWHFGTGLVTSTDNFGHLGQRPTHPALLDWLAVQLMKNDWSIKQLHRLIMLSSTYQMSSRFDEQLAAADPENRYYWRHDIRRLEAEAIRDSLLAVSGLLDGSMGGSMLHVGNREFIFNHTSKDETNYDTRRRSVYLPVVRNNLYDVFHLFDYADASVPNGDRSTSTVAPQALFMMNSDLVVRASAALAEALLAEEQVADEERLRRLFMRAFGRPPSQAELARGLAFLQDFERATLDQPETPESARQMAWTALAQAMLCTNEFLHVE